MTRKACPLLGMVGIENRLADLLGGPVNLIEEGTLRLRAGQSVSRDVVRAFWRSGSAFSDIIQNVEAAERDTAGMDLQAFAMADQTIRAT